MTQISRPASPTYRWALGVLLYEVVVGAVPFTFVDNRPQYGLPPTELYKNILNPR